MKNLKHLISYFPLVLSTFILHAQGENNNWCFGQNVGLNFNTSPPSFFRDSMQVFESSSSVSDAAGNLLFYTSGAMVWDRNNNLMPNGLGLYGNGPTDLEQKNMGSSANGVIIVKSPANSNQYYIITTDAIEDPTSNAYYSLVDMTLNSGLGDVVISQKNITLAENITEGLTMAALSGCNGYWIVLHKRLIPEYYSFKIDVNGISTIPVISTGILASSDPYLQRSQICINPQSSRLARSTDSGIEIASFNKASGIFSDFLVIDNSPQELGCPIFSPDGSKLYSNNRNGGGFYQYDVSLLPNLVDIQSSKTLIAPGFYTGSGRLAPDGKIYSKNLASTYIASVSHPNVAGTACGFVPNALAIPSFVFDKTFTELGSAVLINALPILNIAEQDTAICQGHSILMHAEASTGSSYLWSTGSTSRTSMTNGPGVYTITATNHCGSIDDSILVEQMVCDCTAFVPNAFTPNSDSKNDVLNVFLYCLKISDYQFNIYNRFGQKIFEARGTNEGWDGTFIGKPADAGTYFYSLKYKDGANQEIRKKGEITLIR